MEPVIYLKNLKKVYENEGVKTHALKGIDLKINPGEFVAIMGPSGSGKSTLLHILGFLDRPSGGSYKFEGRGMDTFDEPELALVRNQKLGFVFQAFNLLARTNVLENVKLPLAYAGVPSDDQNNMAMAAIESVGLSHRWDHSPSQLSGGEQQRVALARALINEPSVIFADEPTGNLDSVSGKHVMDLLENLHKQGHTIILITHEKPIARYAQRVITLKDGLMVSDKKNGHKLKK